MHVLNYDDLREFMAHVPGPWLLKPRSQASGIGMKKIQAPEELWPWLDQLGDQQSHFLLEQFVPGSVYHVDGVVSESSVVFAEAHAYGSPPLDVSHQGGVFTTRTLPRDAAETLVLKDIHEKLVDGLGLVRGVTHAEFLKAHADNRFYFIEIAARVGGAYISDVVEAATGINLWREWAHLEVASGKQPYQLPQPREDYAGVILSLAKQEQPDTSGYTDPEIIYRVSKYHHAGFVLKSASPKRIEGTAGTIIRRDLPSISSRKSRFRTSRHPELLSRSDSAAPGTVLHLFLSLVTFRNPFPVQCLRPTFPGTIVLLTPGGNLRGVSCPVGGPMWGNKKPDTPQAAQPEAEEYSDESAAENFCGNLGGNNRNEYRCHETVGGNRGSRHGATGAKPACERRNLRKRGPPD